MPNDAPEEVARDAGGADAHGTTYGFGAGPHFPGMYQAEWQGCYEEDRPFGLWYWLFLGAIFLALVLVSS